MQVLSRGFLLYLVLLTFVHLILWLLFYSYMFLFSKLFLQCCLWDSSNKKRATLFEMLYISQNCQMRIGSTDIRYKYREAFTTGVL